VQGWELPGTDSSREEYFTLDDNQTAFVEGVGKCPKCDQSKSKSRFSHASNRPDGKQHWCKSCFKKYGADSAASSAKSMSVDESSRGPELIDPFGGPDEEDPDLHPDPTADASPFGDEPEDDDGDDDDAIEGTAPPQYLRLVANRGGGDAQRFRPGASPREPKRAGCD
jgi:hypothetical protein